jgi:L-alanine-DL-glutamate epimerase-like enolase superfamily enzyme
LHACDRLDPDVRLEMQFDETPLFAKLAPGLLPARDGVCPVPQGPGLGCELDTAVLAEHSVVQRRYR